MPDTTQSDWWKNAIIYQIYPKSFADTTGSGEGDLRGITAHLDYLAELGADLLWICPVYPSPQKDNGYDVADFCSIDPRFGTMADFAELTDAARSRGIGILMDMILNHTSSEHPWFLEAADPASARHDFYIWSDRDDGSLSVFGDPAWTYSPQAGRYYFSSFSPHQPDLDWCNPQVRQAVYAAMQFWLRQGVVGFRLDAVPYISKDLACGRRCLGPDLHSYLREMRRTLGPEPLLLGEDTEADLEDALLYTEPGGSELNGIFEFGLEDYDRGEDKWQRRPLNLPGLKGHYARWQQGLEGRGWQALFLTNHDMPRAVSRWGTEGALRDRSAAALATAVYLLRGSVVIYQGEELGMTNLPLRIDEYDDLETHNYYRTRIAAGADPAEVMRAVHAASRDNARTPMQWTAGPNAGFSTGKPWLPVHPNHRTVNVAAESGESGSVLSYYRRLLALRKKLPIFTSGSFEPAAADDPDVFGYTRILGTERVRVECNLSEKNRPHIFPEEGRLLLSNYTDSAPRLRPWEARVMRLPDDAA